MRQFIYPAFISFLFGTNLRKIKFYKFNRAHDLMKGVINY